MLRRMVHVVLAVVCLLAWGLPAPAGSFEGRILSKVNDSGDVIFFLHRIRNHQPAGLNVSSATIHGTPAVSEPQGSIDSPAVQVVVPISTTSSFAIGDWLKVSWISEDAGELIGVNVVEL
jgi:hypothetical protein